MTHYMFRKALESILRLSGCVRSCVCHQPSLTLFICCRALLPTGLYANTVTQTEMRGRRRTLLSYKQTHAQTGPWESAMREQVSLFTCGSHGGLKGKYPHFFFLRLPCAGSSGTPHLDGEVGNRWVWCSHRLLTWSSFKVLFTGTIHHHHK